MAMIRFEGVSLTYPLFDLQASFLRNQIAKWLSFGLLRHRGGQVRAIDALRDIDLEIVEGDRVGLYGHNGAGKSTLLRTMAGVYQPQRGQVIVHGQAAMLFDIEAGLDPELSGRENVLNLGLIMGLPAAQCRALTPEVLAFSGLEDWRDVPVGVYSSGMRMRLLFAVATAVTPEILLLDEWFSTGDAEFQEKSLGRLRQMMDRTHITVLASHDQHLLRRYCNRIFVLDSGRLQEVSTSSFASF
ncbi:ABC transporter ATP-binding protein [Bordetella holmesii]|uniref:ABC transporter, ATP-binding protein n=2 Tax=Bordetella holmesii TaxID=35814 RepID=A0A158M3F5_9BORD|nr:ABC transporter ATP-binding protein [Bordetella holmesii]AHV93786.1 ABC transporter family protein [Bordetella holmesii ATCC 51541]AIT26528.1 ABC transporter family protein [Bordetella holmesii 44057]AMD45523.1 ABC transporter ATP-binding protein [Bordetella holmesii H558]AMD49046.1 sugar ABC transporter ATP-binding protein [Bordetella holmesii F627]AOB34411.1 ABC transporter ATP-binding protein [Bordetella holmesii]